MRFIHTADWHLGRSFHNAVLTGDQEKLLKNEFLPLVREEKAEAVIIAGDIYDRGVPPVEAVALFDEVLSRLQELGVPVLYIAGNHDSALRLGFGSRLLPKAGIYVRGAASRGNQPVVLEDKHGPVYFALLPYAEPLQVRRLFGLEETLSFDSASRMLAEDICQSIPEGARSVAVAHAFLAGGQAGDSERPLSVGGSANVSPDIFKPFSYAALGHLHGPQKAGAETIRYSGSLMKYSFGEEGQKKGAEIVELDALGRVTHSFVELKPPRDMRRLKGTFAEILGNREKYPASDDYLEIELTDIGMVPNAMARLQDVFPHALSIRQAPLAGGGEADVSSRQEILHKDELELFADFYREAYAEEMSEEQRIMVQECISDVLQEEREC